jgi:uncharacterized protein (DUF433 family)
LIASRAPRSQSNRDSKNENSDSSSGRTSIRIGILTDYHGAVDPLKRALAEFRRCEDELCHIRRHRQFQGQTCLSLRLRLHSRSSRALFDSSFQNQRVTVESVVEAFMNAQSRITIDPGICHGKPTIRGLRYPVETILELLSSGMTTDEILADYEDLQREDILAVFAYAARLSQIKKVEMVQP